MQNPDVIVALKPVQEAFVKLNISYYIGGSVASSIYGLARTTMDIDLVAEIQVQQVPRLVNLLKATYYIDGDMITSAIQRRASFNLIHLETMIKVDIFVLRLEKYAQSALLRRRQDTLDESTDLFYVATAEDTILAKLEWYRLGGETSERQWRDVLGVLKVQEWRLDLAYMREWAQELKVSDLLEKAIQEAYPPESIDF
jgi:hypothetical protein